MIIPKNVSLHTIENLFGRFEAQTPNVLRLPVKIDNQGAFGVQAALIQLVITWARRAEVPTLQLYCNVDEVAGHLVRLGKQPYGLAALVLCRSLVDQKGTAIDKYAALLPLRPIVEAMFNGNLYRTTAFKGHRPNTVHLCAIQNARNEFIRPFYEAPDYGRFRSKSEIKNLLDALLRAILPSDSLRSVDEGLANSIARLVYELLLNTDEHSIEDDLGNRYDVGLRGLIVSYTHIDDDKIALYTGGDEGGFNIHLLKKQLRSDGVVRSLEISIYDSGPGLAKKWWRSTTTSERSASFYADVEKEVEYIKCCFEKNATTKELTGKGIGLYEVLSALLKVNGYLRIRSGRTCLLQTFSDQSRTVEFKPKVWRMAGGLGSCEGTLLTISIPL